MKGRNPTVDERAFMFDICSIGCIVCRKCGFDTPHVSPHHMEGRVKQGAHYKILPLCSKHHQVGDSGRDKMWISRHADGKAAFELEYGKEIDLYHQCLEILNEQGQQCNPEDNVRNGRLRRITGEKYESNR